MAGSKMGSQASAANLDAMFWANGAAALPEQSIKKLNIHEICVKPKLLKFCLKQANRYQTSQKKFEIVLN